MKIAQGTRRTRVALAAASCCALGGVTLAAPAAPASAASAGPSPTLDCVAVSGSGANELMTAYFGYTNAGATADYLPIGDSNEVQPGEQYQGQPTGLDLGAYPKVFAVTFDPAIAPSISWILNGLVATATSASPQCTSGITTPASGVSATAATLNGVVTPGGTDTTYTFEYGTTPAFGSSTTVTDAGSGDNAELVQAALTSLQPSTTYYFRLDTTTSYETTDGGTFQATSDGQPQTFTTTGLAALTLATTALPAGTVGSAYSAALDATGGTTPYSWSLTGGQLPRGLHLNPASGVISGTPRQAGTRTFAITVTDSGTPVQESLRAQFSITVAQ